VDGPLIAKVQPALVVTHSVRVAPVAAPDGAVGLLLTQYALLLSPRTVPGSKPVPALDAAPSTGTSKPVTKSREYHNTVPQNT
jgi:hypothetical protein